jgi:hypothetical protein
MLTRLLRAALWVAFLVAAFTYSGVFRKTEMLTPPFSPNVGYAFSAAFNPAPPLSGLLFTPSEHASRLILFENGRLLPNRTVMHSEIRERGEGRYSHWGSAIIFSASDNSDPNLNGRAYMASYPWLVRTDVIGSLAILVLALEFAIAATRASARRRAEGSRNWIKLLVAATGRPIPVFAYWSLFAAILALGIALRAIWTYAYGLPGVTPDTRTYLLAAAESPALPFSEMRTAGVPLLLVVSVGLFGHPSGILLAHNLLWLGSTLGAALAVRYWLAAPLLSLCVLAYLSFSATNLAQEYLLMSEHLSRVLYVFFFAAALYVLRWPDRLGGAVLMAFLVFCNILSKPSAVVLVVATPMFYALLAGSATPGLRWRIASNAMVFLALVIVGLLGYAALYDHKYGKFALTSFQGWNLFSHTGHLVNLDSDLYPEIKQELRQFMPIYIVKYAKHHRYRPNWLVYGSTDAGLRTDFGDQSPAAVVRRYASENDTGGSVIARMDRIYLDLALEGIRTNPQQYLAYATKQALELFKAGYSFDFYPVAPSVSFLARHAEDLRSYQEYFTPRYSPPNALFGKIESCAANFFVSAFCSALADRSWYGRYTDARLLFALYVVDEFYVTIATPIRWAFDRLPTLTLVLLPIAALPLAWRGSRRRRLSATAALLATVLFGYGLFLGLLNVSDPPRFLATVQDLIIFMSLAIVFSAAIALRRLVVATVARRAFLSQHGVATRERPND